MQSWTEKQRDIALRKARVFAKLGHANMTVLWVDRARSFDHVSIQRLRNIAKLLDGYPLMYHIIRAEVLPNGTLQTWKDNADA